METKTIAIVMGTRPEVIKLASVVSALQNYSGGKIVVINIGQHREMISQALERLESRLT